MTQVFQTEMCKQVHSVGPEAPQRLESPWLWTSLFCKISWQTGCCLVPQDFTGLWKLNSSHWLLSTTVELDFLLGQELSLSSDCVLCCSPSSLTRLSCYFWPSNCDFFPAWISHLTRVMERFALLLSTCCFSPAHRNGSYREELHQATAGENEH